MPASIEKSTFWMALSFGAFTVSGYLIYFILGKYIFSVAEFGAFATIVAFVSLFDQILVNGFQQSVSKFVSEEKFDERKGRAFALKLQLAASIALFAVLTILAVPILGILNYDSGLFVFQVALILLLTHPVIGVFMGFLNGKREFVLQSKINIFYVALKFLLMVLLAAAGFRLFGAIAGFVISSFMAALISLALVKIKKPSVERAKAGFPAKRFALFTLSMVTFAIVTNIMLSIDLFFIRALSPAQSANFLAGLYSAATVISRIPQLAAMAFIAIAFPLISYSVSRGDARVSNRYVSELVRYSLIIMLPMSAVIIAYSGPLLSLFFSARYSAATATLSILAVAAFAYSLFFIMASAISASGRPRFPVAIGIVSIIMDASLNFFLIPAFSINGAAISIMISFGFGSAACIAYAARMYGNFVSAKSLLKMAVATAAVFGASGFARFQGILLIPVSIGMLALFFAVLYLLGEIGESDFSRIRNLLSAK
ncbi:MAG: polysaccharide biosynthesis C-terminal domain-containing protein [archaeon]